MQEDALKKPFLVILSALTLSAACTTNLPLKDAALEQVPIPIGVTMTKSMGEPMLIKYTCPCYEFFVTTGLISFKGYDRSVASGTEWISRYVSLESGEKFLTNRSFHRLLALVVAPGNQASSLSVKNPLIQIEGGKEGRSWKLSDSSNTTALRQGGYNFTSAWRLQYVGTDKQQSKVLRFTIEDLRGNRERVGQVEYTHDLDKGIEFVVRGVRIRISSVAPDGLISYVLLADNEQPL
jgi:hypothetical protein